MMSLPIVASTSPGTTPRRHRGVLVSMKFCCFLPSRFSHFHCNAMRKAIKAHKNFHTNQKNEHTPGQHLPQLHWNAFLCLFHFLVLTPESEKKTIVSFVDMTVNACKHYKQVC